MNGWYYLHENKELIYKPSNDAIADIRESDFAIAVWPMDSTNRAMAWQILIEALAMGASEKRIKELAEKWNCDDKDAAFYASHIGLNLFMDGNQWCAAKLDMKNIQEDQAGFGSTCLEAMADLCKKLGFSPTKLNWHPTFHDLVKVKS